jgi:hypothetical protein
MGTPPSKHTVITVYINAALDLDPHTHIGLSADIVTINKWLIDLLSWSERSNVMIRE